MDADFVPVGASSRNRSRSRYETQYAKEGFDDAFLYGRGEVTSPSQIARDERTANFDIRLIPTNWLAVNAGVGRSEETTDTPLIRGDTGGLGNETDLIRGDTGGLGNETEALSPTNATIRDNFNWGINFNQRLGSTHTPPDKGG